MPPSPSGTCTAHKLCKRIGRKRALERNRWWHLRSLSNPWVLLHPKWTGKHCYISRCLNKQGNAVSQSGSIPEAHTDQLLCIKSSWPLQCFVASNSRRSHHLHSNMNSWWKIKLHRAAGRDLASYLILISWCKLMPVSALLFPTCKVQEIKTWNFFFNYKTFKICYPAREKNAFGCFWEEFIILVGGM